MMIMSSKIPLVLACYFGYCTLTSVFVAHSVLKSIFWSIPLIGSAIMYKNLNTNVSMLIEKINLLEDGLRVEIRSLSG